MLRYAATGVAALCLSLGATACGSNDKKSSTSSSKPAETQASTTSTSTSTTPATPPASSASTVSAGQKAETNAAAKCMIKFVKKLKPSQLDGNPALLGVLKTSGNVLALVMYGPKGGASQGFRRVHKSKPTFDLYRAPSDKILIMYGRKANKVDKLVGNVCQMAAAKAG